MTKRTLNVPTHLQYMQAQRDRERALRRAASASWRDRCKAVSRCIAATASKILQSDVPYIDDRPVWHCPHCERPEHQLPVRNGRSWGVVPDARGESQRVCLDCVDAFDASVRVQKFCEAPLDGPIH